MMDIPEKEVYKVMQTNTLVPALPSPSQLVSPGQTGLSGTEMVHAFNVVMKEFYPL